MLPRTLLQQAVEGRQAGVPLDHAGLILDKLAPSIAGNDQIGTFVRNLVSRLAIPPSYHAGFKRWQKHTSPTDPWRRVVQVDAQSPLMVGLGNATPIENGLSLHPTYGVPYLPGSSLKGVTRAFCTSVLAGNADWGPGGPGFRALFGWDGTGDHPEEAGSVDFLDAWLVPVAPPDVMPDGKPWMADITTPHFKTYYQGAEPPHGFDGPNPITFLAARGRFRLVLEGPPKWLGTAEELLLAALKRQGVGARTRSGQGRLQVAPDRLDPADQKVLNQAKKAEVLREMAEKPPADRLSHFAARPDANPQRWALLVDAVLLHYGADGFGDPPELEALRDKSHGGIFDWNSDEDRNALAEHLVDRVDHRRKKARKHGKERDKRWLEVWEIWRKTAVTETVSDDSTADQSTSAGTTGFGDKTIRSNLRQPSRKDQRSDKNKSAFCNKLANLLKQGGFREDEVRHGLQVLADLGAGQALLTQVRQVYGL